jgi:hypothetical protein
MRSVPGSICEPERRGRHPLAVHVDGR